MDNYNNENDAHAV